MNQTITYTHRGAGGTITKTITVAGDQESRLSIPFASDASDVLIDIFIPDNQVKAITFLADQDCTLEFNDNSGTLGTITLTANLPVYYFDGCAWTYDSVMGFAGAAGDITAMYLTNTSDPAAAGTLSIIMLIDATPA